MSDYYESEIEPIYGLDDENKNKNPYEKRRKGETKEYYACLTCGKKGKIEKVCCGTIRTKCYNL
jgi:hypothetical protein